MYDYRDNRVKQINNNNDDLIYKIIYLVFSLFLLYFQFSVLCKPFRIPVRAITFNFFLKRQLQPPIMCDCAEMC